MSRRARNLHRPGRRYPTKADELLALRDDIATLRRAIRAAFEGGARSDDPVVVAAAHAMAEREARLAQLEAESRGDVGPRAA